MSSGAVKLDAGGARAVWLRQIFAIERHSRLRTAQDTVNQLEELLTLLSSSWRVYRGSCFLFFLLFLWHRTSHQASTDPDRNPAAHGFEVAIIPARLPCLRSAVPVPAPRNAIVVGRKAPPDSWAQTRRRFFCTANLLKNGREIGRTRRGAWHLRRIRIQPGRSQRQSAVLGVAVGSLATAHTPSAP
ncbi:hypothetical protein N657DRAFT_109698 [Parathielavia appendiculata]|uniref:Uncharacterized protein n=1 Tax=Parathielavia appendiculata TaxID=2587402 RepID=A0AAN6TW22_9PEZI|nr:hypothetical protein N657DRAFT_109698 [Parathielavia appendiculata]